MCGIIGLVSSSGVNQQIYDALTVLQHRGQDAAGMVTSHDRRFYLRKANGLVRDVFEQHHMQKLVVTSGLATFATQRRVRPAAPSRSRCM